MKPTNAIQCRTDRKNELNKIGSRRANPHPQNNVCISLLVSWGFQQHQQVSDTKSLLQSQTAQGGITNRAKSVTESASHLHCKWTAWPTFQIYLSYNSICCASACRAGEPGILSAPQSGSALLVQNTVSPLPPAGTEVSGLVCFQILSAETISLLTPQVHQAGTWHTELLTFSGQPVLMWAL